MKSKHIDTIPHNCQFSFQTLSMHHYSITDIEPIVISITIVTTLIFFIIIKKWMRPYIKKQLTSTIEPNYAPITNALEYNSSEDPINLLLHNFNLTNIIINTEQIDMSYEDCLTECFKQSNLIKLSINTKFNHTEPIRSSTTLPSLLFVHIRIENNLIQTGDHLKPILQRAKNLESIIYENGYLDLDSMYFIPRLKRLNILILDNVVIRNQKAFNIMLFNLRFKTLIVKMRN